MAKQWWRRFLVLAGLALVAAFPARAQAPFPNYTLLRAPNGATYVVVDGVKHRLLFLDASAEEIAALPEGEPVALSALLAGAATPALPAVAPAPTTLPQDAAAPTPAAAAAPAGAAPLQCGDSLDCLLAAATTCSPARGTVAGRYTVSQAGIELVATSTKLLEIRGTQGGECQVYTRIEAEDLRFDSPLLQGNEAIQQLLEEQIRATREKLIGLDGTCSFTTDELAAMLSKWRSGAFGEQDWAAGTCSGKLFQ